MDPIFKNGDDFNVPIQFYDTETGVGLEITADMEISSRIIHNSTNRVIGTPTVTA